MEKISPLEIVDFMERRCNAETWNRVWTYINQSEENRTEFFRIKKIWALKSSYKHASANEVEDFVRKFNAEITARNTTRRLKRIAQIASSVAALLAVALLVIGVKSYTRQTEWHTIANATGAEVMKFDLDDGTKVYLNEGAELSYREDFKVSARNVRLRGEAFFEVTSDPMHPFTVEAAGVHVKVLGTSFNVRTGDRVETVLEKGRIAVETPQGELLASMIPGQRALVDATSGTLVTLEEVATEKYTAWHFNRTVFDKISFAEIVRFVEERHGVSIIYDPKQFSEATYRLVVSDEETLEQMLGILDLIIPIDYQIDANRVMIKKK